MYGHVPFSHTYFVENHPLNIQNHVGLSEKTNL